MKLGVYKFDWDYVYGIINGIFIADEDDIKLLENSNISIYFGEVLGKHSEVEIKINPGDFTLVTDDPEEIETIKKLKLFIGFNPLDLNLSSFTEISKSLEDKYPDTSWYDLTVREYINILKNELQ